MIDVVKMILKSTEKNILFLIHVFGKSFKIKVFLSANYTVLTKKIVIPKISQTFEHL